MVLQRKELETCKGEQPHYYFMHKGDGLIQLTVTCGHMQSEQPMMEETMLQPETMMNAQYQDLGQLREYQPLNANITLDVQYMYCNRKFKMVESKEVAG
jgi:hypothetical protein